MTRSHSHPQPRSLIYILILACFTLLFFARFLFTRNFLLLRDLFFSQYPWHAFCREYLLQGILPLWNPYTGCGEPFLANMEAAVFYPPNLIFLVCPVTKALSISAAFHVLVAAAGTWTLCVEDHYPGDTGAIGFVTLSFGPGGL